MAGCLEEPFLLGAVVASFGDLWPCTICANASAVNALVVLAMPSSV